MTKVNNGYFIKSYRQCGIKPRCGCVEFTFDNIAWFTSKLNLGITALITVSSLFITSELLEEMKIKFMVLCIVIMLLMFISAKLLFCIKKETLYVIAPIGVQFVTTYLLGKESVLFVPWHMIKNFVIVEIIVGQQIFFYLGLQNKMDDKDGLIILFQNTRPRLRQLEEMYRIIVEHSPPS